VITGGIDYLILNNLGAYFNFSWTPIYARHIWHEIINGTYKGLIGDVYNERADLAIGDLSMSYERNQLVDFSIPYAIEPVTFLSRNVHINSEYGLLDFFVQNHWYSYGVITAIFFSTAITILFKLAFDPNSIISSLSNNFHIILEALLLKPHSNSQLKKFSHHEKVLSIFWRFTCMILLVIYSTFILTSLIRDLKPIESIEELRVAVNDERVRVWYYNKGTTVSQLLRVKISSLNFVF
jgi:hypothetical protein